MVMDVQVELRIKAMQPVLIPGPEQIHPALGVLDVGESTYQDLGSVGPGKGALIKAASLIPRWLSKELQALPAGVKRQA